MAVAASNAVVNRFFPTTDYKRKRSEYKLQKTTFFQDHSNFPESNVHTANDKVEEEPGERMGERRRERERKREREREERERERGKEIENEEERETR